MSDLNSNFVSHDASVSDIQILNQLIANKGGANTNNYNSNRSNQAKTAASNPIGDMPSIKLFKRMTTLKKEKNDIERECSYLKEKLDDFMFLNQKLDEALKAANDKVSKYENDPKSGGNVESTNIGDSSLFQIQQKTYSNNHSNSHRRQISFDPQFLA